MGPAYGDEELERVIDKVAKIVERKRAASDVGVVTIIKKEIWAKL
jgi:hypothetical protein